jgi:hypothetical protein
MMAPACDPDTRSSPPTLEPPAIGRFVRGEQDLYRNHHRTLYRYWQSLTPGAQCCPHWRSFDPLDIPPRLLPNVWATQVERDEAGAPVFRERIVGTRVVEVQGRETTGMRFDQIYTGARLICQLATYGAVLAACIPHVSRLRVPHAGREFLVYDRLILPFTDREDGRVSILAGAHAYDPEAGEDPEGWPAVEFAG